MDLSVYSIFKMPFCADTRCGFLQVSLNVYNMIEELSELLYEDGDGDKEYFDELDTEEGSIFYMYIGDLEDAYSSAFNSNPTNCPKFFDWLYENYNSIESWVDVEKAVEALKIEERENEDFQSYRSWALGVCGDQLFCSGVGCEYSNYCEGATKELCLYHERKYLCGECGGDMDIEDEEQEDMFLPNSPSPIPNPPSPSPPSPNHTYQERMEELERQLSQNPTREERVSQVEELERQLRNTFGSPSRSISPPHTVREPTPPPVYSPPTTKEVSTQTWIG